MLKRQYKTYEKNPTQWEISLGTIYVDLEEAKKVFKFDRKQLKDWLCKQVNNGEIEITEMYNPDIDEHLNTYLDQKPMGYGLYLKSDKGFIQDGFYTTEEEAISYQEERAEEMPDLKTFIFKTHDNEN
jgi:hypothetical protein